MTTDAGDRLKTLLPENAAERLQSLRLAEGRATLVLDATGLATSDRDAMEAAVKQALEGDAEVSEVRVAMMADKADEAAPVKSGPVQKIIAVGSGKGGVAHDSRLVPVASQWGVPVLSMAHLSNPGQAIAWRGPMASGAVTQLLQGHWDDAEIIVVDLPPGTGDIQLTMLQRFEPAGAVIGSTPQDLALMDATRAVELFSKSGVPIVGVVENMAGYICPHCGEVSDPFGTGGAEAAAREMGTAFLGRIPLDIAIRRESDAGTPTAAGDGPQAEAFANLARSVADWVDSR